MSAPTLDRSISASIYDVLGQLRSTALDERDKGDKYERLVKTFLLNDPEWAARFSNVWLWSEWPGRDGRPDTGVDLVAQLRDRDTFAAIQCKFYAPGSTVSKADIDSFLSASGGKEFSARYIFDTAKSWSPNSADTIARQAIPVQRVDIAMLGESEFDWAQYSWSTPEVLISRGKKALRPHQQAALMDVFDGFRTADRGKLIMACGTGKTFTSLKIAETIAGPGASVLFLVPSIQLLSQSLREWMANTEIDIRPFAVCSDVRVGRKVPSDETGISAIDLTEPATTDAETLIARMSVGRHAKDRMTVVFSTYQSIGVIAQAQKGGVAPFDLIVCDEAHRTTGVTLANGDESAFVKVHDNDYLHATKRLYMTATPRVFGEDVKRKAKGADAVLADMNDESMYGPEFHRLGFGDAVDADLLTDYKVLVLAVDEQYVADHFQTAMTTGGEIALPDAAKLLGCWNGLAKHYGSVDAESEAARLTPMKTAVAFAKDIKASKTAAGSFPALVDRALQEEGEHTPVNRLRVEAAHVDGTMGIHERNTHLAWLKEQTPDDVCRILTNARCLSEGVDVPALDAVMFLTPRGSQVDVVQSVGRVMRKAPGKELGYIILPVVVPSGVAPEEALKDNERYKVVWQVLQALRSHDDRFHAMVNQIELNKATGSSRGTSPAIDITRVPSEETEKLEPGKGDGSEQGVLDFGFEAFRDAMFARIVKKVGERRYWETWAKDVADIANRHMVRIRGLLSDEQSPQSKEFADFLKGLRANLNDSVTTGDAVEMLAQHLVTRPIFDALFGTTSFVDTNPVAKIMELMLTSLDEVDMSAERENLEPFYASVRRRVTGVDNAEGKQRILVELYDKFFSAAFKKTVDKLGIVYTPIEIVDFILRSADAVMRQEFGRGLTDEGVRILDGFVGTGTFLVRLLQSGLIKIEDLPRKYEKEMAGQEILLLAYYIAAANLQMAYEDITGDAKPFPHLALADTFQSAEDDDQKDLEVFTENNDVLDAIDAMKIDVIVGNPPYSSGQDSANDNNANEKYPSLDASIRQAYADRSTATNKNSLYDSYIRAIRWATRRIGDRGVIAFVTNGGFLDSNTADGMRNSLADDFSTIHVYNLRGNARTAGEHRQKEGGTVFGGGSRATVAITVLVKDPQVVEPATIHYSDVGDYLSTQEKLAKVAAAGSVAGLEPILITPNEQGDWLNQRRDDFATFVGIADVFDVLSGGLKTNRDAWCYSFGSSAVDRNMRHLIQTYETDRIAGRTSATATADESQISWNRSLLADLDRGRIRKFDQAALRIGTYRPFMREHVYFDRALNDMVYRLPALFPGPESSNVGIYQVGAGSDVAFSVLSIDDVPNVHLTGAGSGGQFFARYRYEPADAPGMLELVSTRSTDEEPVTDGYRRIDNITGAALERFTRAYPGQTITKDDIFCYVYALLHSPAYRETYAADLKKMLPRIPFVKDFVGFAEAGRRLSELHLGYESVAPYPLGGLDVEPVGDPYAFFAVGEKEMRFAKVRVDGNLIPDRSTIHYNDRITLSGIPEEAYRYQLGSRSAIEWIIDRYYVKTDKASGIVNDPNDWSREVGDPRYIIDLLARIVTVSVETMKVVDALPSLEVLQVDRSEGR